MVADTINGRNPDANASARTSGFNELLAQLVNEIEGGSSASHLTLSTDELLVRLANAVSDEPDVSALTSSPGELLALIRNEQSDEADISPLTSSTLELWEDALDASALSLLARVLNVSGLVSLYDVADTTSLRQGITGAGAAAIGAVVGTVLDKALFGDQTADEFIAAQTEMFTDPLNGWTVNVPAAGSTSIVGGKLRVSVTGTTSAYRTFTTVIGRYYRLQGRRTDVTVAGLFRGVRKADNAAASTNVVNGDTSSSSAGDLFFKATATTTYIHCQVNTSGSVLAEVDFDQFSLKEANGYHAFADTTGHRPTLHSGPYVDFDGTDDVLYGQIGVNLGSACAVYHRTQAGDDVWLTAQTINSGAYALSTTDWGRAAIFTAEPSASDKLIVEAWGAAYPTPPFPDGFLALEAAFDGTNFIPTSLRLAGQNALDKLVLNGDGTSKIVSPDIPDFYPNPEATIRIRYRVHDDFVNNPASGVLVHWTNLALNGVRAYINTAAGTDSRLLYQAYSQSTGYLTQRYKHPDDGGTAPGRGLRSVVIAWREGIGELPWAVADNFIAREETVQLGGVPDIGAALSIAFGRNEIFDNDLATNVELWSVDYKKGFLSPSDMEAWAVEGAALKILEVGDSFVTSGIPLEHTLTRLNDAYPGVYIAIAADGVGGTTLSQQRDRMLGYAGTEYEKWYDSYLLILDGANGDSLSGGRQAVLDMLGMCGGNGAYVEPSPQFWPFGDTSRIDLDAKTEAIRVAVGDNRFIPTFAAITNTDPEAGAVYHDGSAEDLDYIAQGFWPMSLLREPEDFHPGRTVNGAGWSGELALGDIKAKWMIANGVVP